MNLFASEFKSQTRFILSNSSLPALLKPYALSFYSFLTSVVNYSEFSFTENFYTIADERTNFPRLKAL